jgi:hypothetical protein
VTDNGIIRDRKKAIKAVEAFIALIYLFVLTG